MLLIIYVSFEVNDFSENEPTLYKQDEISIEFFVAIIFPFS